MRYRSKENESKWKKIIANIKKTLYSKQDFVCNMTVTFII